MSNAVPIRIADAVVSELNDHSFAIGAFTATRSTGSWDKNFTGLKNMSVDVVYRKTGTRITMNARGSMRHRTSVAIAVRQRFEQDDRNTVTGEVKNVSVDPLDTLVVDIAKKFIRRSSIVLSDATEANYEPTEIKPMLGNENMLRQGLYYGFVSIEFTYSEAI